MGPMAAGKARGGRRGGSKTLWKWLGLAGVVGVTATGVAVARAERQRQAYTPDQVRERLHSRLDDARRSGGVLVVEPDDRPGPVRTQLQRFWRWCTGGEPERPPSPRHDPEGELNPPD